MSEPEDRSYYEIALTNGQVLTAFAVLLACVLGSFVAGMWVARESMGPVVEIAAPAGVEGAGSDDTLQFFGDEAAADLGGEEPEPGIQQVRPMPAEAVPTPAPPVDEPVVAERSAEPSPEVRTRDTDRRESVVEAPPARDTAPEPAEAAPSPGAGFVIQVFSSNDEGQADALLERLRSSGFTAFRRAEEVNGRTMYRVRVGPYAERSTAESEAAKLKRQFRVDTWITGTG